MNKKLIKHSILLCEDDGGFHEKDRPVFVKGFLRKEHVSRHALRRVHYKPYKAGGLWPCRPNLLGAFQVVVSGCTLNVSESQ